MATIITKNSQTASAVPSAASLSVGELAVNTADGKLYTEHTGGVVKEIIPSTVVDGGITEAKIATGAVTADKIGSSAVTTAKIADANVTGAKLENSGVTAGTYTTATVTVDAKGRITSASSGSGGGVSSLNGQTGAITNTNFNAIGSYVKGSRQGASYSYNSTYAGSGIAAGYMNSTNSINCSYPYVQYAESESSYGILSGTWRAMSSGTGRGQGLFVRIS